MFAWLSAVVAVFALAGCGGGGGGSPPPPPAPPPPASPPPPPPPPANVTISGRITYDFVPVGIVGGLDYAMTEVRPARLVSVTFVENTSTLASTQTDNNGEYSLNVPVNRNGFIQVRAESETTGVPGWHFRVVDNTDGDALYTLNGSVVSSGSTDSSRDLHAPSGWTGSEYGGARAAAPFAILDTVIEGSQYLLAEAPLELPPLDLHWSPDNVATFGEDGVPDPESGEIGTSFYTSNPLLGLEGIYLLGSENNDTEEYDRHVILHEFGHYLHFEFGRLDGAGGPHGRGDRLDMRVAFSEGWGTAFAGLALGDSEYRDTGGFQQSGAFGFDIEGPGFFEPQNPAPGWYSEESVWELVYDLVDTAMEANDNLAYPFADVWSVVTGQLNTTPAISSIFPLLKGIRDDHPGDEALLDELAAGQLIDPVTSDFAEGETNDADSVDVLPIYTSITVNGAAVNLCSTDEFTSSSGAVNKLGSRRFLRFTSQLASDVTIKMTATSIPAGEFSDPDFILHRRGPLAISGAAPSDVCQDVDAAGWSPDTCFESETFPLTVAQYVLEIYEWTNTNNDDDPEFPPIGRTCFDVTVTQ